jgi:adenylate cyclase
MHQANTDTSGIDQGSRDEAQASNWLATAFRTEELAGLRLATRGRTAAMTAMAVLVFFIAPRPAAYYYEAIIAIFVVIGLSHYTLNRNRFGQPWIGYLFVALDLALLTFTFFMVGPLIEETWTPQMFMRTGVFVIYFLFIATVAFSYSPRLMVWAGFIGALGWSAGVVWTIYQPGTVIVFGRSQVSPEEYFDPRLLDINIWTRDIVIMLLVAGLLAVVVWRSRRLVIRQAESAHERANLSRYFPPNLVDELAHLDEPLGAVRAQPVAVMFADIVGFTRLTEQEEPDRMIEMLREFHARLESAVFDHGGTLDKFLGDGVMATFGTPHKGPRDAANAVSSALAMLTSIGEWNQERAGAGQEPIRLSIGVHYGEVVLGNIGSERRLEFAVLGDVVNVASRLEGLTRLLECKAVVSDELVQAIRIQADGDADSLLSGFRQSEPEALRGREESVAVWMLPMEHT